MTSERDRACKQLRRLERDVRSERERANAWEKKASLAVAAGNDELARQSLALKIAHEKRLLRLQVESDGLRALVAAIDADALRSVSATTSAAISVNVVARTVTLGDVEERVRELEQEGATSMAKAQESLDDIEPRGGGGHGLQPYVWAHTNGGLR